MNDDQNAKKKDILELIQVTTLQPEQVDVLIPAMVRQSLANYKGDLTPDELVKIARTRAFSNEFLEKFAVAFDEIFTHDEIKKLIGFYKSEEMRKFFKNYTRTCAPIYPSLNQLIEEVISSACKAKNNSSAITAIDQVIAITKESYQQEVCECEQPVVLDVYSTLCGPCKTIAPILSELSNELNGKVKFLKLNIDKETSISQDLEIYSVPTLLFLKKGKIIDRHVGVIQKAELDAKIKKTFQ